MASVRFKLWLVANAMAMMWHVYMSSPLWHCDLEAGDVYAAGPGDGLYFLFLILVPWIIALFANMGAALFLSTRREANAKKAWMVALLWIILGIVEQQLSRIPDGMVYLGS